MKRLSAWLGMERTRAQVGLRAYRKIEVAYSAAQAFALVREGILVALGANIDCCDATSLTLEAAFGLVDQRERICVGVEALESQRALIRIEARYPVGSAIPESSPGVDALANFLDARLLRADALDAQIRP